MSCPANVREVRAAIGYQDQATISTPNIAAEMFSFTKLNDSLANLVPQTENDADWIGKGDEFATQSFLDSWTVDVSVEKYLSSQFLAHCAVYGLGHFTYGGSTYTCSPANPITDCIEMKPFSYLEAIRQGGSAVLDRVLVGMAVEEFQVILGSGPGLNNSRITATYVGTGKYVEPSTITVPAISAENIMSASTLGITVNGVDYVTNRNIVSATFGFKNNIRLDSGYYPGSGFQDASDPASGHVRGRMEFGNRALNLSFVARFVNGSTELATLKAQSYGTAVLTVAGTTGHAMTATFQKVTFKTAVIGNTDGIVTVAVDVTPVTDAVNGLFTLAVTTDLVGIGS